MREFGKEVTLEQITVAMKTAKQPFNPPTEIAPIPSEEEMQSWYPSDDPEKMRWRTEINVTTGERKWIELTLEEYRQRHVDKIRGRNKWLERTRAEERQAHREALLAKFIDELETKG